MKNPDASGFTRGFTIMKSFTVAVWLVLGVTACLAADPTSGLPRSRPEAQGVSPAQVLAFVNEADTTIQSLHSFMLVRHGKVVAEGWWTPYGPDAPHSLYSLSKSFTSTAVGLAVAEGKLSVDDEVLKFFPDDAPATPSNNLKAMRVRDLLRMSAGHQSEASLSQTSDVPWTKTFLAQSVPHKPGTHFMYNTPATFMLSAIVQKATGSTVLDYLKPRLFEPLGIDHPTWGTNPQGISLGGYGLSVRTEDIARFGQLYLQKGQWQGEQLVPESWVAAATARQTSNGSNPKSDWDQGYGYQFWRSRHHAYRGDGAFGQYCLVLPEQDAVIAITSGVKDMQGVLNLVWDKLLPALKPEPLPPDDDAHKALLVRLASLSIRPPQRADTPSVASKVAGKTYTFPANDRKLEAITLEPSDGDTAATLTLRRDGVDRRVVCGKGTWRKGRIAFTTPDEQPAAASGAWTGDETFTAKICFYETPFIVTLNLKFAGDKLLLDSESNVAFGPTSHPRLEGRVETGRP
jgi:CubicO group peptidase (beta-lactamase class C family)